MRGVWTTGLQSAPQSEDKIAILLARLPTSRLREAPQANQGDSHNEAMRQLQKDVHAGAQRRHLLRGRLSNRRVAANEASCDRELKTDADLRF